MDDEFEIQQPTEEERRGQFDHLTFAWLANMEKREISSSTRRKYLQAARRFYAWCHDQEEPILLGDVTRADVIAWRDELTKHYRAGSVIQNLAAVRSFYDFLLDHEAIHHNPAHRVPGPNPGPPARKRGELTDNQVSRLLAPRYRYAAGIRDRAIIHLMAYCALRPVEVHRLNIEDIAAKKGRLILWVWGARRKEPDSSVTLPAPAAEALQDWLDNRPDPRGGPLFVSMSRSDPGRRLSVDYVQTMIRRRLREIGVKDKSASSLRSAAIKNAIRRGGDPLEVRQMARHKKLDTTLGYYKHQADQPVEDLISYEPDE